MLKKGMEWLANKARKAKVAITALIVGGTCAIAHAESALDGFVATNATTGDPELDASVVTSYLKSIVVSLYTNWIGLFLIFVIVGLMIYVIFGKKGR